MKLDSDERVNILKKSVELLELIKIDQKNNEIKQKPKFFTRFNEAKRNYEVYKKEAENEYNEKLNKIINGACKSDDHETVFEFLQLIQTEGNTFTESQVKYKIRLCLLGGFGCKKNISQGRELIKKASKRGLSSANDWIQ
ncbi:41812_t:CDS:1, partial [Gigaspora margarita]